MPIKWSALKVSEATGMIEEFFSQSVEPLEQARIVAREARKLDNLPQYIDQGFSRIISEIDRAIGGSQWEPIGRIRAGIQAVRDNIPADALKTDKAMAQYGSTLALV